MIELIEESNPYSRAYLPLQVSFFMIELACTVFLLLLAGDACLADPRL